MSNEQQLNDQASTDQVSNSAAFELLSNMRDQARELSTQDVNYAVQDAGMKYIAYAVGGVNFYTNAQDIKEVTVCENLMVVPQTKRWMRGLVNSKGTFYSVNDLSLVAGFEQPTSLKNGHLLLINNEGSQSALLVSRVIGFRYFAEQTRLADLESHQEKLDGLSTFVDDGFSADDEDWYHLDVNKLLQAEQFLEVQ